MSFEKAQNDHLQWETLESQGGVQKESCKSMTAAEKLEKLKTLKNQSFPCHTNAHLKGATQQARPCQNRI